MRTKAFSKATGKGKPEQGLVWVEMWETRIPPGEGAAPQTATRRGSRGSAPRRVGRGSTLRHEMKYHTPPSCKAIFFIQRSGRMLLWRWDVTPSRRLCYAATPSDLSTRSPSGPAHGMALASAYAISGLPQTELCSSIYGMLFQEDPVQVLSLSECIPHDFFLNRWIWSNLSSEVLLLIPLEARISDVKRAEAQLARDQDRALSSSLARCHASICCQGSSPIWQVLWWEGPLWTPSSWMALTNRPQRLQERPPTGHSL